MTNFKTEHGFLFFYWQTGSIMDASWPAVGKVDMPLLKSADYLADRTHEFRLRIKTMMNPKGKKVLSYNAFLCMCMNNTPFLRRLFPPPPPPRQTAQGSFHLNFRRNWTLRSLISLQNINGG